MKKIKVLIIGGGGREHCLAWKISKSRNVEKIYVIPGNAGIAKVAECIDIGISKDNFNSLVNFVKEKDIDLTVVGPEASLVEGIVDYFEKRNHKIFGPNSHAAQMEGSKVFSKKLVKKYKIPTAGGIIFRKDNYKKVKEYIKDRKEYPVVIKADGLAAGKGVVIAKNNREAIEAVDDCFIHNKFGKAGNKIIIEDFLTGYEVSILCLSDGKKIIPMALAQDYKRIFDNDKGKNTGGMGSYSPVPMVNEKILKRILEEIVYPTNSAMRKEGINYRGILYIGVLVNNNNPYLLEYNCRFGDPETQVVLPRLKNDLVPLILKCIGGNLKDSKLNWDNDKCVCVVLASRSYPESSSKGDVIKGLESFEKSNKIMIFHAGTKEIGGDTVTDGGRILGVVSKARNFKEARNKIYSSINKIKFTGKQYRKDIASKAEKKKV